MMPKVFNKHHNDAPSDAVYIGRGSPWGNPFSHMTGTKAQFIVATREEAIRRFEEERLPTLDIEPLRGKNLLCFCSPKSCHGDVILKALTKGDIIMIEWARKHTPGYEVSSVGDKRFSAFQAIMPDGRSIEHWYQCDIKGYNPGGTNWRLGKGKAPKYNYPNDQLYELYLSLWRIWAIRNHDLMNELAVKVRQTENTLTDCFASTPINQARALAQILNEWF